MPRQELSKWLLRCQGIIAAEPIKIVMPDKHQIVGSKFLRKNDEGEIEESIYCLGYPPASTAEVDPFDDTVQDGEQIIAIHIDDRTWFVSKQIQEWRWVLIDEEDRKQFHPFGPNFHLSPIEMLFRHQSAKAQMVSV
jgi:hypothetical protein